MSSTLHEVPREEESFMDAVRGRPEQQKKRRSQALSPQHLEQRDRALVSLERAEVELRRLADIERGESQSQTSPRLPAIREVIGEVGALWARVDRTYV